MKVFEVAKREISRGIVVKCPQIALAPNEVRLKIESFSLTANNVSYALAGDSLKYWDFFPASQADHGRVPVMGIATVVASLCEHIQVGERVWGWFPMADEIIALPADIKSSGWVDSHPMRGANAPIYRHYERIPSGFDYSHYEHALKGLFTTSWLLASWWRSESFMGANTVYVTSASSKTALALAHALRDDPVRLVGVTSPSNVEFVTATGCYHQVVTYEDELGLSSDSLVADFAGRIDWVDQLAETNPERLKWASLIGATHGTPTTRGQVVPERTQFFFAPMEFERLKNEIGGAALAMAVVTALREFSSWFESRLTLTLIDDLAQLTVYFDSLVKGRVAPSTLLIVQPSGASD
ncbi:DUF2855 family protein [Umboniibacter marinipuniceus]|uniref:Uncharacterized protein DUF2855 n=1 Tax=Umboniibacter marinipuniceus TaxID=569599 RepID=A0A3L9ZZ41_9GAMM|nr:DUF2855 family protein [Umboniibacter marinipuniceus]RMA77627.1 uncharacterized protein DUF2855 [Umboniibacter marinipuniceus]